MVHHGAGLRKLTDEEALARAIAVDPDRAQVGERERAMLDYALKLTRAPSAVQAGDVEVLRTAGFDDRAILDICQIVAYYNYVNRLADGLGVELEDFWEEDQLVCSQTELPQGRSIGKEAEG